MKLNLRITAVARLISLCLALCMFVSGCGSSSGSESSTDANTSNDVSSEDTGNVSVESENVDIVGNPSEEGDTQGDSNTEGTETDSEVGTEENTEGNTEDNTEPDEPVIVEPELSEEQKLWQSRLIANVKKNLNVRKEANSDADIVGKLGSGAVATIIEKGEEWTKIKSGNVEGYVSNEYCLYGDEALQMAKGLYDTIATVTVNGLRIREEMSTESSIVKKLDKGDDLIVDSKAEVTDGWVAVIYREKTYYVSADYVTLDMDYETGLTSAEIKKKEEEEAAKRAQEELEKITDKRERNEAETRLYAKNLSDLDVMAAIIYCEAGGESYETQLAVASVIMNRVKSSKYPNSIKEVVLQKYQFSPVRSGSLLKRLKSGKVKESCVKAAKEAMSGVDSTNGCLFFRDDDGSRKGKIYLDGMVFY